MGTTYSIKINSNIYIDEVLLKKQIDELLNDMNMIFSTYHKNSELSIINNTFDKYYYLSDHLFQVLDKSLYYSSISNGYYDPTVFPLVNLWGFGHELKSNKPKREIISNVMKNISYKFIVLDSNNHRMYKTNPNIHIDLNSIAKGYAIDILYNYLIELGHSDFMVEIGGELRCNGNNNNNNWVIGISNPISGIIYIKTLINDLSIATSGTYNNFTIYDNVEYSHIINPLTGYPISNNTLSCTIISNKCVDADALATMLMVLPYDEGIDIVNSLHGIECLIITGDNKNINKHMSNNFDKYLTN